MLLRFASLGLAMLLASCESVGSFVTRNIEAQQHLDGRRETPHRVAILRTGRDAFLYRLRAIRTAQTSIHIQTFILNESSTTRLLVHELMAAARRGVEVRFLTDSMFSQAGTVQAARAAAGHARVQFRVFNPVTDSLDPAFFSALWSAGTNFGQINRRMHNKLMIVDDKVGICGGRNYDDEYFDLDSRMIYLDRDVVVTGDVVADMVRSFDEYWSHSLSVPLAKLHDVGQAMRDLSPEERGWPFSIEFLGIADLDARVREAIASGLPRLQWQNVQAVAFWADRVNKPGVENSVATRLIGAIGSAEQRILVQTPYMVLTNAAMRLFEMRRDPVEVKVHTNSLASTDNWASYAHAMRQRYEVIESLRLDVREMKPYPAHLDEIAPWRTGGTDGPLLSMHAKSLVIDERLAIIGSYNLDPRSEVLNSEVLLAVWDEAFATRLAGDIEQDCRPENSWVVAPKSRPLPTAIVLGLIDEVNAAVKQVTTFDLWPIQSCALFEMAPGGEPGSRFAAGFYEQYRDVGLFPGVATASDLILVQLARSLTGVFRALI